MKIPDREGYYGINVFEINSRPSVGPPRMYDYISRGEPEFYYEHPMVKFTDIRGINRMFFSTGLLSITHKKLSEDEIKEYAK